MVAFGDRLLRPAEVVLLVRYREAFSARVLDVGCGSGRFLGYLVTLGGEVHGVDSSPRSVEACRRAYPEADVRVADARELTPATTGSFEAVLAAGRLIDGFEGGERVAVLSGLRDLLSPSGLLIFSARHDQGGRSPARAILSRLDRPPSEYATRLRKRMRDGARTPSEPHPISRAEQLVQLDELGLEVLDVLDGDGRPAEPGLGGELYWVVQRRRGS